MILHRIDVPLDERVLVLADERPVRYLRPGRHWVVNLNPLRRIATLRLGTGALVARLKAEHLALVPAEDLKVLRLAPHARAVVSVAGRAVRWLGPGEHQVWTVERTVRNGSREPIPSVEIEILDVSGVVATPLRDEVRALAPASDYVETTVPSGAAGVRYVDGVLDEVLGPGRHASWTALRKVSHAVIDLRERVVAVNAQEVMTKDHVTLRLNLAAEHRVADVKRLATVAREADEVLYLAVQVAAREAVASRTLDELLATRDALAGVIAESVAERAESVGLRLLRLVLKDVVLPGEMKTLLNRVIEARTKAEANVILRREETAAARSLAQTARVLAENPLMLRLKELEAYAELAGKVGQVHVMLGQDALPLLQLKPG